VSSLGIFTAASCDIAQEIARCYVSQQDKVTITKKNSVIENT
jgi:hypothetical protein